MEDQDCYEFVKFFIEGAQSELLKLKDPSPTAKLVQSGANVVPQSLGNLGMGIKALAFIWNTVDEIFQGNKKRASDAVVDSTAESSKDRKEIFIRMFIPPALEIYHSCKNQLKLVRRGKTKETVSDNASKRKAIEILATFIGAQCFELMIEEQNKDNLDKILIKLRNKWKKPKTWATSKRDQLTEDNLYMTSDSKEQIDMDKYKFFKRLIPAFSSGVNLSSSALQKDYVQLYVNETDKSTCTSKLNKSKPIFLRGPTHSDNFPIDVPTSNFAKILVVSHSIPHPEVFTPQEKIYDETVQKMYDQLMKDPTFETEMAKWAHWQKMQKTNEKNTELILDVKQLVKELPAKTGAAVEKKITDKFLPLLNPGNSASKMLPCPYESDCRPEAPSFLFVGRRELIQEVQTRFASPEKQSPREHIIIIAGLGGMGKSEFCRKFAKESLDSQVYAAVFWIEAESFDNLRQCIIALALHFNLPPFTLGNTFQMNQTLASGINSIKTVAKLTQAIYAHVSSQKLKTLFIFDNADNTENFDKPDTEGSKKSPSNANYQKFSITSNFVPQKNLPFQPHILITTTLKFKGLWPRGCTVLDMPVFSLEDTVSYFKVKFDIPKNQGKYDEEIKKLHSFKLHGFPLATAIAFAYIRKVGRSDIGQGIKKYIELFASKDWIHTEGDSDVKYDKEMIMRNVWTKVFEQLEIRCPRAVDLLYTIILSGCWDFSMLESVPFLVETNGLSETGPEEIGEALGYLEDFCLVTKKTSYLTQFLMKDHCPYPTLRTNYFVRHFYSIEMANDSDVWRKRRKKLSVHGLVQKVVLEDLKNRNKGEEKFLHVARVMRDMVRDRKTDLQLSSHLYYIIYNLLHPVTIGEREPFFRRNISFILSVILADPLYLQLASTAFALFEFQKLLRIFFLTRSIATTTTTTEMSSENGDENRNWNEIEPDLDAIQIYFLYHSLLHQIGTENLAETERRENCPLKNKDFVPVGDELRNISCQNALTWIWSRIVKYQDQSENVVDIGIKYLSSSEQLDILLRDSDLTDTALKWILTYQKRNWHILLHFVLRSISHSLDKNLHRYYGDLIELYFSQLNKELQNTGFLAYGLLKITENLTEDKKLGQIFRVKLFEAQAKGFPILDRLLYRITFGEERNGEHEKNVLHTFCIFKNILIKYEDHRDQIFTSSSIVTHLQSFLKNWLRLPHFDESPFMYDVSIFKILRAYFGLLIDLSTLSPFSTELLTKQFFNSVQFALHKFQENATWMNPYQFPTLWMMFAVLKPSFNYYNLDVMRGELFTLVHHYSDEHYKHILDFYDELEKEQNGNQSDWWKRSLEEFIQYMESLEVPTATTDLARQASEIMLNAISEPRRVVPTPQTLENGKNSVQQAIAMPFESLLEDTEHVRGLHTFFYRRDP